MGWPATQTKAQSSFITTAYLSTGNMTEALLTLDTGDPVELKKLAGKWGITITDKTALAWLKIFEENQGELLPPGGGGKIVC